MIEHHADVVVLGSGFGGSLTALLLHRIGLEAVLVERSSHPRFAIGESSTPIADAVLRDLSRRYDLPRLEPLTSYGTWQSTYPELTCGLKRGFSYFRHELHQPFLPRSDHANELLVAASSDDLHSDTHWLRSDVDHFFVREVQNAGIVFLDRTDISEMHANGNWLLTGKRNDEPVRLSARFLIDATGPAGALRESLSLASTTKGFRTNSRTIYGHFVGMKPWHDVLVESDASVADHPYRCDRAALHHVFDDGWMWQLGFNNGVTSAGFVLDAAKIPLDPALSADEEWNRLLDRYPSIRAQFAHAQLIAPDTGLQRTGRLQRAAQQVVGKNWAMLPYTIGFIDPLHSAGIALTLCGVERLISILQRSWDNDRLPGELGEYARTVQSEVALLDELVSSCYAGFRAFDVFIAVSMLYFAGATTYERRRFQRKPHNAFLCADDAEFRDVVRRVLRRLPDIVSADEISPAAIETFGRDVAAAIRNFNTAGLCDPSVHNMYRYTAVPV